MPLAGAANFPFFRFRNKPAARPTYFPGLFLNRLLGTRASIV